MLTEQEQQKLWELCGFEKRYMDGRFIGWKYPNGEHRLKPPLVTLNNLFKYAVPKVKFLRIERQHYPLSGDWLVTIQMYKYEIEIDDNDPAEALARAILKMEA